MSEVMLAGPILICLTGALLAAMAGALKSRITPVTMGWVLSGAPVLAFAGLCYLFASLDGAPALSARVAWMPSLGLSAALYVDHLSLLFGLLITGIGSLVVVYSGYYFQGKESVWRFFCYLLLFMTAMLGLVMAGDLVTLFVFWEGTSITSFLLIGYTKTDAARRGALKSLLITGGGGIALLAGFLLIFSVTGSAELSVILTSGDVLRESPLYAAMFALVAIGAFTKSAQFPAHIWLPDAMAAPTPASAYLHSATMVKAGIYLMARLNPALGHTETWFWTLSAFGMVTMLLGAVLALKQHDLKALLAYTTVSQLGLLMMLIGQDTEIAFKALVIGLSAHALYKGALFLVTGAVDHETGTRDLRRLGGLARAMPLTTAVAAVACLSMAGLPPLFGFLAKETNLATVIHPTLPSGADLVMTLAAVVTGALMFALALMLFVDVFWGKPRDGEIRAHEAPRGMLFAPLLPAAMSLAVGLLPEPPWLARLLAGAAGDAFGESVKVSLAIWTGINPPLLLSLLAIALGAGLFAARHRARATMERTRLRWNWNGAYDLGLRTADGAAHLATRAQHGRLRDYMAVMLMAMAALVFLYGKLPWPDQLPPIDLRGETSLLRAFMLLVTVAAAAATLFFRQDLMAILAVGASGLGVAVLMALEPSPDLALVQVVVDILTVIVLVLLLTRLPQAQREHAGEFTFRQNWVGLMRDAVIAIGCGVVMTAVCLTALVTRPRESALTPFFEANAKTALDANDIVGAILMDFRALDTLMEIVVFCMAGLGVYTLLRFASLKAGDEEDFQTTMTHGFKTLGIGGVRTSPLVQVIAYAVLPLAMVMGVTHVMYGHDQPGDGFTAGVIISVAVGLWYVVFGYDATKKRLPWLKPSPLIGGGIVLALLNATLPVFSGQELFGHVDYGALIGLPLPHGFHFSNAFVFEVAICLSVLGSASFIIETLGHPKVDVPTEARER